MDRAALPTGVSLPYALDQAKISRLPATAYYISDFISEEEEKLILDKVRPPPTPLWSPWWDDLVGSQPSRSPAHRSHAGNSSFIDGCKPGPPTSSRTDSSTPLSLTG